MYVDSSTTTQNGKTYVRHLLRSSFRQSGKIKHKTVANLSHCSKEEVAAIKLALKHKDKLESLFCVVDIHLQSGKRFGAVWCLLQLAREFQIHSVLGSHREGKLALWQILARLIEHGSRLSAVRLAQSHLGCELLGLDELCEDDLYKNLAWLAEHQEKIERLLFARRFPGQTPSLFLYDVTSSYLEGDQNELGTYGYNRDGKRGKKQIVIGLLADSEGDPVAVRVFEGNTPDGKTVAEQVRILAESFGVKHLIFVGDRGMLKSPQIKALPEGFNYLTAITKPQIRKLMESGVLQYEMFDESIGEVEGQDIRYILRRNPMRAEEMKKNREEKRAILEELMQKLNRHLIVHPRAHADKAFANLQAAVKRLKTETWCKAVLDVRTLIIQIDDEALHETALLDGCYVLKSDVPREVADAKTLHDRYKDLTEVERAFRTMKTAHLEIRPVYVRKENSTRGHVFVTMLAYLIRRRLEKFWSKLDLTVEEGLDELGAISVQEISVGQTRFSLIPKPNARARALLDAAKIDLPAAVPTPTVNVATRKKLPSERIP